MPSLSDFAVQVAVFTCLFAAAAAVFLRNAFPKRPTQNNLSALAIFNEHAQTSFEVSKHYDRLTKLQSKYNITDYTKIGFYRAVSPITDFRSFGILSLDMLERSKIVTTFDTYLGYGLTMINIGFQMLYRMNEDKRFLCKFVFDPQNCLDQLAVYLDREMQAFAVFWRYNGADIMAFNQLLSVWMKRNW